MSVAHVEEPEVGVIDLDEESEGLCRRLPGPCEFVSCRHNIATEATWGGRGGRRGTIKLAILADKGRCTCSLELASDGEHSMDEIAEAMGLKFRSVYYAFEGAKARLTVMRTFATGPLTSKGWKSLLGTSKAEPSAESSGTKPGSASESESSPTSERKGRS